MTAVQSPPPTGAARLAPAREPVMSRVLLAAPLVVLFALPLGSWVLGLYAHVWHWGKVVHAVEGLAFAMLIGVVMLGWREHDRVDLTDELVGLVTMCAGVLFGVAWKVVEFVQDWSAYADVEKSNSDTMTDFLWNDVGVVIGALLVLRLYAHAMAPRDRADVGAVAHWLVDGSSRVLDRHGLVVTIAIAGLAAAAVLAVWFASRPLPGLGVT